MSAAVTIYTTTICPYCVRAKALLSKKGVAYREINVETRPDLRTWLIERSKQRTVPQIFVNGAPLGGFSEIAALDSRGELDALLAATPAPTDPPIQI
jgi:glutaredoxin 3